MAARTPHPRAALVTLGCPSNQVDSERIMGGLVSLGFEIVPEEEADIIVVNTCGFISDAREESMSTILDIAELKSQGRLKKLVVAGCMAERYAAELREELHEADAIVGLAGRDSIPELCRDLLDAPLPKNTQYARVVTGPPHTGYLRIAEGCGHLCTFCAIPFIRGDFRSDPADALIRDAEELASTGVHELILVGQDTTAWGSDLGTNEILAGLLPKLAAIDGIDWIRLMYAHPAHMDDRLIEAMAGIPQVLPYIDLPLQHISGDILRRMGRRTPPERIRELVGSLREKIEGVVIRTSLIVGFPGETEHDFNELMSFVREARFERMGAFVYSPEEGTAAADFGDAVPEDVAVERYERLMTAQAEIAESFHQSLVGREFDVIVDGADPDENVIVGRTYMDAPDVDGNVTVPGGVEEDTPFLRVRITGAEEYDLAGELVQEDIC